MAMEVPDTRSLSDEVPEAFRIRAVAAKQQGHSARTIADILGLAHETVQRWCTAFKKNGVEGLPSERTGRPVGSGRRLSEEQERKVREIILDNSPEAAGVAATLWTRKAIRDLIHKTRGQRLPVRTVGLYLERRGWTPQRPKRKNYYQDAAEVQRWLKTEYPKIAARAKAEGAEIQWGDETGVEADDHSGRGYAPPGRTPERAVNGRRLRINLISTITNQGKVCFMLYTERMTSALFIQFLARLTRDSRRKIFLIVDRLPAHHSTAVQEWLSEHREKIEMFLLPPYSPELNPDERLNCDVKANVHEAKPPETMSDLKSQVGGFMSKLARLSERVASYFQDAEVAYAGTT